MDTLRNKVTNHNTFRYRLLISIIILVVFLIVTGATVFKGDTGIDAAFAKIVDAVNVIIQVFSLLCSIATSVLQSIADLIFQISSPVGECSAYISPTDAATIAQNGQAIQNSMSKIQNLATPVLNALHSFIRAVQAQKQCQQWIVAAWTSDAAYTKLPLSAYLVGVTLMAIGVAFFNWMRSRAFTLSPWTTSFVPYPTPTPYETDVPAPVSTSRGQCPESADWRCCSASSAVMVTTVEV